MGNFCVNCGKRLMPNAHYCTHCGASLKGKAGTAPGGWSEKKAKVLGEKATTGNLPWTRILGFSAVVIVCVFVYAQLPKPGNAIIEAQPVLTAPAQYPSSGFPMYDCPSSVRDGKIIIPYDLLREKKFLAFEYNGPTHSVPLLAYVSGEGKIVTAVSMCEPCNSIRFHIEGEEFVCNSCGTKWALDDLQAISGACGKYPPDVIPNSVVGNEVLIDEATVAGWQRRI